MKPELVDLLTHHSTLFIQQRKEWTEIVIDWETSNKYAILDSQRGEQGFIAERGGGFATKLKRLLLRSHRPLDIDVLSRTSEVLLHLSRAFFWFFSDLDVKSPEGERFGSVHRRFGILRKIYDLKDETGHVFARIESPIWRLWTFPVVGTQAVISKKWGGALRELFTDADTYRVDFSDHPWSNPQRAVLLAAAISIDFDFFENNQGRGGLLNLMPGWD